MEFIDDHQLLIPLSQTAGIYDAQPSLVLMNTEKIVHGRPMQTFFHLTHYSSLAHHTSLLLEAGGHKPFPEHSPVPFYGDPTQRIIVLDIHYGLYYVVIPVGALLELLKSREGSTIGWDEWKSCVFIPSVGPEHPPRTLEEPNHVWVSGCWLFFISGGRFGKPFDVQVYNFSMRGCAKYRRGPADGGLEGVKYLMSTGVTTQVPSGYGLLDTRSGYYGVVFYDVSVAMSCSP